MNLDPTAPLVVVRAFDGALDPAVDWEATDAQAYRETRDMEALKLIDDKKPAKFYLRRMTAGFVLSELESVPNFGEKTILALRASLYRIELPNGQVLTPKRAPKSHGNEMGDEDWVTIVRDNFGLTTCYEMAALAIKHASLPQDQRGPFV